MTKAMDNKSKVEWMEANVYDTSKNTCPAGKSCSLWFKNFKNDQGEIVEGAAMQTCQECHFAMEFDFFFFYEELNTFLDDYGDDYESKTIEEKYAI